MAIPIPARPSGYRLGQADAPIAVEMFLDLECPFSKRGWNNVMKVVEAYSLAQVSWTFQLMTLGNHRQCWDATKAVMAAAGEDMDKFVDFVTHIFSKQAEFANEAWKDKTQTEFHQWLAECAAEATEHTDKDKFIERINSQDVYAAARIPARHSIMTGVWSTPTFFINGAEATALSSGSSLDDWKAVIDPLF
ncbi:MAG: thioredoxin domain-containing protein [Cyanobacteria bacterium J06621_11]